MTQANLHCNCHNNFVFGIGVVAHELLNLRELFQDEFVARFVRLGVFSPLKITFVGWFGSPRGIIAKRRHDKCKACNNGDKTRYSLTPDSPPPPKKKKKKGKKLQKSTTTTKARKIMLCLTAILCACVCVCVCVERTVSNHNQKNRAQRLQRQRPRKSNTTPKDRREPAHTIKAPTMYTI